MPLHLSLSPERQVYVNPHTPVDESNETEKTIRAWFSQSAALALLRMAATKMPTASFSQSLAYWYTVGSHFIEKKRKQCVYTPDTISDLPFDASWWRDYMDQAPPMLGGEYLDIRVFQNLWVRMNQALAEELRSCGMSFIDYLAKNNPHWEKVGQVCFHLAENKNDGRYPFAFLATYMSGFSDDKTIPQHIPLSQALKDCAGDHSNKQLLYLLAPVHKAAKTVEWVRQSLERKNVFNPQRWTPQEAYYFLKSVPQLEEAGLVVRIPNWWSPKPYSQRPKIAVSVGNVSASLVSGPALLDFRISCALPDGTILDSGEIQELINAKGPFVNLKGQWVEANSEKIKAALDHWEDVEKQVSRDGLNFAQGMRLLAGAQQGKSLELMDEDVAQWSTVVEGEFFKKTLKTLKNPENDGGLLESILKEKLRATLRPYQMKGVLWLWTLYQLRLGGCLADDMGLGKTMQIISLLLLIQERNPQTTPHLLIVPASLLGNWQREISTFAPELTVFVAHTSGALEIGQETPDFTQVDVVMTTYGNTYRLPWIQENHWHTIILDEAQAIKNPSTKQTLSIKGLKAQVRFILTGTPVENRLQDLWSLFDFCSPGLLGSSKEFSKYGKETKANESTAAFYGVVRKLVAPYILRRLKSDKSIISDLPDKTETTIPCFLSKKQIKLYQGAVSELSRKLNDETLSLINRKGMILSYLMAFKQICNHPSHYLGHGVYDEKDSGKFIQLRELCEIISEKQEKVLVFTQYAEIIPHLHDFMATIFDQPGLVLYGGTPVSKRQALVESFQSETGPPFFILSLKAGGTGLNLTGASHVIHFDRWWNPAVENQATDRAYRIGQKKNVLVHKFVCQGTLEEKIDNMIRIKKHLASSVLGGAGGEYALTEMSNKQLLNMISLDIHQAILNT